MDDYGMGIGTGYSVNNEESNLGNSPRYRFNSSSPRNELTKREKIIKKSAKVTGYISITSTIIMSVIISIFYIFSNQYNPPMFRNILTAFFITLGISFIFACISLCIYTKYPNDK